MTENNENYISDILKTAYDACVDELKETLENDYGLFNFLVERMQFECDFLGKRDIDKWKPMSDLKVYLDTVPFEEGAQLIIDGYDHPTSSGERFNPRRNYYRWENGDIVSFDFKDYTKDVTVNELVAEMLGDYPECAEGTKVESLVKCICGLWQCDLTHKQ